MITHCSKQRSKQHDNRQAYYTIKTVNRQKKTIDVSETFNTPYNFHPVMLSVHNVCEFGEVFVFELKQELKFANYFFLRFFLKN